MIGQYDYNCGGYALGTFDWYHPYKRNTDLEDFLHYECESYKECENDFVEFMLKDFDGRLRLIDKIEDAKRNERVFAFRCSDDDFHFVKVLKKNKFIHKMGWAKIEPMSEEEFNDAWCGRYDGTTFLFAMKK